MVRLQEFYKNEILPELKAELELGNDLAVPRLTKVVVSMGTGSPQIDKNRLDAATADLGQITGQKPTVRPARKSVSNFKTRAGMLVGCCVTLRGQRMYEFVDRLIHAAIPRMRDFRGLNPRSFDGHGNYTLGVSDQSIFPEIDLAKVSYRLGMNVTLVTSATTDEAAKALLLKIGLPIRKTAQQD